MLAGPDLPGVFVTLTEPTLLVSLESLSLFMMLLRQLRLLLLPLVKLQQYASPSCQNVAHLKRVSVCVCVCLSVCV